MTTLTQPVPRPAAAPAVAPSVTAARVRSVDALRGFDMFWIIGAGAVVQALEHMSPNPVTRFLSTQLRHVRWEGFRFYDVIFPLFLFLIGVSIVFSLDKALAQQGRGKALWRVVRRSVLLYLLGVFYYGGLSDKWPNIMLGGVLQRIALCYLGAALVYCFCPARPKVIGALGVALLVGYWALLALVPFPDLHLDKESVQRLAAQIGSDSPAALAAAVPGRVHGVYEEGRNLTNYFDFRFLPGKKTETYYINEGLLSTLPSISLCLFGILAGRLLKNERVGGYRKIAWLLAAGGAAALLGWLWGLQFPVIKRIWSSSFVLIASGYSAMLLAAFYLIVDVWLWRRWCEPFVWIGTNAITIYLAVNIISFPMLAKRLAGGDVESYLDAHVAQGFGGLVVALTGLGLALALVGFLYRKRIFLRL